MSLKRQAQYIAKDYPFLGCDDLESSHRELRIKITAARNLSRYYVARLTSLDEIAFAIELINLSERSREVQSDLLQCLIELRGGLSPLAAGRVIDSVGDLVSQNPALNWRGEPLVLWPPDERIRVWDRRLYERSRKLYEYVLDASQSGWKYDRDFGASAEWPCTLAPPNLGQDRRAGKH